MITLDFNFLMEDTYEMSADLYKTVKSYLEFGVNIYMNFMGELYLDDNPNYINYIGKIKFIGGL